MSETLQAPSAGDTRSDPTWEPTRGEQRSSHTLRSDEILRTRAFLIVSGTLAIAGAVGSFLLDGDPTVRLGYVGSSAVLVAAYIWFYLYIRDKVNYSADKALAVLTACNFAAIAGCAYYGFFSPCPMILMLPIGFYGLSQNGRSASIAYVVTAAMLGIPMVLLSLGIGEDPGLVQPVGLGNWDQLLYGGLVQLVFGAAFLTARLSRRATDRAVVEMEQAWREVQEQGWALQEANEQLERARGGDGGLVGQVHGPWRLTRRIGRGGMGDVYAATHTQSGERAALKFLGSSARNKRNLALFEREAALLASIRSVHVVHPIELHLGDPAWLAMELLEGEELGDKLRRLRRLSLRETAELVTHAAEGLSAAHEAGIVHRDVKPGNLFQVRIDDKQVWKLVDFGISKLQDADSTLTRDRLLGTPGYMAPEQLRGDELDDKTDQFALAAVAYRALVGRAPFRGKGVQALLYATLSSQPPRPSDFVAVPNEVEMVLAMGLAKSRVRRFPTVDAFATAFVRATQGQLTEPIRVRAEAVLDRRPWGSVLPI